MDSNARRAIRVVQATRDRRDDLESLLTGVEAEDHPDDPEAARWAPAGVSASLARHDMMSSDTSWVLMAYRDAQPVGLAVVARIPKLDARVGFLYVDELHVLAPHRRCGVGTALLRAAGAIARDRGLAGIRLLTRPENEPAQALYDSLGGRCSPSLLYRLPLPVDRHDRAF